MEDPVSFAISCLALFVSTITAWLTFFRVGTVKMTLPTVVYFGIEVPRTDKETAIPKIYLRSLLFSTSRRGRVIESMHVALSRNETLQNFNIWVYGDDRLMRGSGLFVGETGVAANHHFLAPNDSCSFRFVEGRYKLEVFARLLGDKSYKGSSRTSSRSRANWLLHWRTRRPVSISIGDQIRRDIIPTSIRGRRRTQRSFFRCWESNSGVASLRDLFD